MVSISLTTVEDSNLRFGYTTHETRFNIRFVFTVAVATCWTTSHFDSSNKPFCPTKNSPC